jgi:cardiolipin synthase
MEFSLYSLLVILVVVFVDIGLRLFAIGFIPNNRKPSEAMAWLIAIFFMPLIGFIAYLIIGQNKLSKKRMAKQQQINELIYEKTMHQSMIGQENYADRAFRDIAILNSKLGALPLVGGNNINIITDYQQSLNIMTKRINNAKKYVHAEFYIMSLDKSTKPFFESLVSAQNRGVEVRVLFDHIGSWQYKDYQSTLLFLQKNNLKYHLMLPFLPIKGKLQRPDLRNHRKLLVIDGIYGFTGSQNIIDSTYNKQKNIKRGLHWKELMIEAEGPIVNELDAIFIGDWHAESDELLQDHILKIGQKHIDKGDHDCQIVPSGPGFEGENNLKLFTSLMYLAKHKIIITSPYFVPDETMLVAITTASQRGVQVELYVSEIGDQFLVYHAQRSYYEAILRAGVKIYLYKSPTVLHAKHFTIDDHITVIGTSNMDMRSLNLNFEISMLVNSKDVVKKMRQVENDYKLFSRELTLEAWLSRPIKLKFLDNASRLTSSLQ